MARMSNEEFEHKLSEYQYGSAAKEFAATEARLARRREEVLEELVRRLLKAREAGMSLSDMQAMAREVGVEP